MKLLFKQRAFSWLDSYDIKGKLSFGHCFEVYDARGREVGYVEQRLFTFLPKFDIYSGNEYVGCIKKEFSLFTPEFSIDFNGWQVEGNPFEWDYNIIDSYGNEVATVSKELFKWTDTYSIEVYDANDALHALMLVLAIDAEKCSRD